MVEAIACLLILLMHLVTGSLQGVGCEDGWLSYSHYCYSFVVNETDHEAAWMACEDLGGDLASVWTEGERTFITHTLWQPRVTESDFAWFGLYGTTDNRWAYLDRSDVIMSDGVLSSSSGEPASKAGKCGAFMGTGGLAFLDCSAMTAQAFVCKKALPRVFANSALLNETMPDNPSPLDRNARLFERVWPPLLSAFPQPSHYLAEGDTDSETGCAFRCYNVRGCNAFQVTCITSEMCRTVTCTLLTEI